MKFPNICIVFKYFYLVFVTTLVMQFEISEIAISLSRWRHHTVEVCISKCFN